MTKTKNNPTVSVIIPTYNRAHLIGRAIQSVLNQTYQDFEIIVVDDGSTDNTDEVVKDFGDERIGYIRHKGNKGGAAARNTGIRAAKGEYIAFLDDDDEFLPNKIESLLPPLQASDDTVGLVYSKVHIIESEGKSMYFPEKGLSGDIFEEYLAGPFFQTNSTLIKRDAIALFDESLPRWQDADFHLRILRKYHAIFVDIVSAKYYVGRTRFRITNNPAAFVKAIKIAEERYFSNSEYRISRETYAKFLRHAGDTLMYNGDVYRLAHKYFLKSFIVSVNIGTLFALLSSIFGYKGYRFYIRLRELTHRIRGLVKHKNSFLIGIVKSKQDNLKNLPVKKV